ncbi:phosphotransferase [Rhodococcoides corynebacterioides]|uniref:phosphotransferase n=1 Tax=Rhodococcoides corynebacterioides TaxID=53972 RepID=UPI003ADA709A
MKDLLSSERDVRLIDESNEILALLNRPERVSVIEMRGVGRNRTWAASRPGSAASFFFKVLVGGEKDCENRWRRLTAVDVTGSTDADIPRPRCIGGLPERRALVYQNLPGARSAAAVFAGDGLTLDTASRMGEVVARVHRHQPESSCPIAEAPRPAATDFYVQSLDQWSSYSAGQLEFWRLLHSDRDLASTMAALGNAQIQTAFVHGDLRLDQFMLLNQAELYLCDWEKAGWGDPSHDVAGVVGGWLYRAINRVRGLGRGMARGDSCWTLTRNPRQRRRDRQLNPTHRLRLAVLLGGWSRRCDDTLSRSLMSEGLLSWSGAAETHTLNDRRPPWSTLTPYSPLGAD